MRNKLQLIIVDLMADKDTEVKIESLKLLALWSRHVGVYIMELINNSTIILPIDHANWRIRYAC